MNTELLKARQTKYAAYATLYILVMLAVVTVANVLANRYDKSFDATSNKRYSLSDQTVKIVKGLKQGATITYFGQVSSFSEAKDKLEMYGKLSPKVHVEYVDPDKNPQAARQAGIKNYGTTIVRIGTRTNEAKSTSEEDVSGAIIRDLKNNRRLQASGDRLSNIDAARNDNAVYRRRNRAMVKIGLSFIKRALFDFHVRFSLMQVRHRRIEILLGRILLREQRLSPGGIHFCQLEPGFSVGEVAFCLCDGGLK